MQSNHTENRPLSPHLTIYRPQFTSVLSILHRITGIGLMLSFALILFWFISLALGQYWFNLINSLLESGIQKNNICIDFSLTRNLAYYDGVVFDLIYKNELIGGGGKYDDLPKMLGYQSDYSCFGFAINISKLTDVYNNE